MSYKRLISEMQGIAASLDMDFVMNEVRTLTDIEYPQTFAARANSADYVEALLKREGFDGVERIDVKADGKATFQDKRIPMSWDVTKAKLTVLSSVADLERQVVADYDECPFSIIWGSVSTPEGGTVARIIITRQECCSLNTVAEDLAHQSAARAKRVDPSCTTGGTTDNGHTAARERAAQK